jgi:hypothetical protein
MHGDIRFDCDHKLQQRGAVPDVGVEMRVAGETRAEALKRPTGVSFGPEENGPLVVIDAEDRNPRRARWPLTSEPIRPQEPVMSADLEFKTTV